MYHTILINHFLHIYKYVCIYKYIIRHYRDNNQNNIIMLTYKNKFVFNYLIITLKIIMRSIYCFNLSNIEY